MSKTSRNLRAFSWGKFSWTEMICVKKLTLCNSDFIIDIGLSLSVHGTLLPIYLEPDLHLRDALAHECGFQG